MDGVLRWSIVLLVINKDNLTVVVLIQEVVIIFIRNSIFRWLVWVKSMEKFDFRIIMFVDLTFVRHFWLRGSNSRKVLKVFWWRVSFNQFVWWGEVTSLRAKEFLVRWGILSFFSGFWFFCLKLFKHWRLVYIRFILCYQGRRWWVWVI